jgi:hypothetical protein
MANTAIQIKFSEVTATPTSLNVAEPAYSYTSNTLFIGTPDSTGAIAIGGKSYVDSTTAAFAKANAANVLAQAAFAAANAASATSIDTTARVTANAGFDKANTANVLAQAGFDKANTDVTSITSTAGVYGNTTFVPVITLSANGRISSITNTAIEVTPITITGGSF